MFDYASILAQWEDYPLIMVAYGDEARGWARGLDATHGCLANVPCAGGLMVYDIVTLDRDGPGLPRIAQVLQRYYHWRWCVAYGAHADVEEPLARDAAYATLYDTCVAAGCAIARGPDPGLAVVNAPTDVDLRALLEPLGLVGDALTLDTPARSWTTPA